MVPKKLTDCPENLRESIDWLIQIRNGGDKTGLQNLAKALDKLINKAIEDAENSLKAEEEKLKCPIIYEGNLSYCQVNDRSLDEAQKKLEELKAKGDPESQSQRKQLEDEIEQLKQYKQKCIDDTHPRYPESQALKGIRAKLKASQELSKTLSPFLKDLQKTAQNHGDSILHNLCSGLETFLGFDAATKGYTGKGIVYADLDRLCDAVMAFLHECLKDNESLLKHYYPEIVDTIEFLAGSIGKGLSVKGLGMALDTLRDGLEGYESGMDVRIENFLDDVKSLNNNLYVKGRSIESFTDKNFIKVSTSFRDAVESAIQSMSTLRDNEAGFKNIDKHLKGNLNISLEKIDECLKGLHNGLQYDIFVQAVNTLQSTFDTLPDEVERFISDNFTGTTRGHKKIIDELKKQVKGKIDESCNTFQKERLRLSKIELENAVATFRKNAKNLGGLRSDVVKKAIDEIEYTLKDESDRVDDQKALNELKNHPVGEQIGNIVKGINRLCAVKSMRDLEKLIGEPKTVFEERHQLRLSELVKQAKSDLELGLNCTRQNAKNLGGLKNTVISDAIRIIQEKLEIVDLSVNSKIDLEGLAGQTVIPQITKITQEITKDNAVASVTGKLQTLEKDIGTPGEMFNKLHQRLLDELATKGQTNLLAAVSNVTECIETHSLLHKKEIKDVLEAIEKAVQDKETPDVNKEKLFQIVELVGQHLASFDTKVDLSVQKDVQSLVLKVTSNFANLESNIRNTDKASTAEFTLLVIETITYVVDALYLAEKYSVRSDGTVVEDVDETAKIIRKQLENLKDVFSTSAIMALPNSLNGKISPLHNVNDVFKGTTKTSTATNTLKNMKFKDLTSQIQKAQKDVLNPLIQSSNTGIEVYVNAAKSLADTIDTSSTKQLSQSLNSLTSTVENVKSDTEIKQLISATEKIHTEYEALRTQPGLSSKSLRTLQINIAEVLKRVRLAILNFEYSAFQTAIDVTRAEVSAVVEKAKKVIGDAEEEYQKEVTKIRGHIESEVENFESKAKSDQLHTITSAVAAKFSNLTQAVSDKSVFNEDVSERKKYFTALENRIKNTVDNMTEAYKNAYKSAAKSYLSSAISKIKMVVGEAEAAYDVAVGAIAPNFGELIEDNFKSAEKRTALTVTIIEPFQQLESKLKETSAFKKDYDARTKCFAQLKSLIKHTVTTLSTAYEEAYRSSAKTYLIKAINKIKEEVNKAEANYVDAINVAIKKVKEKITGIQDIDFKEKTKREALTDSFNEPFETLQKKVKECSVFTTDFVNRATCFTRLQNIVNGVITGLIYAGETFDNCASMAENYLTESFNDASLKITSLGNKIHDRMKQAFDKIILEVYTMYSKDKIAHMQALNTCIERKVQKMKSSIEEDKRTGIKGLLKTLSGVNPNSTNPINRLERLKDNASPKELAPEVKSYLDSIFIYVWNDIEVLIASQFTTKTLYKTRVENIKTALNELFNHLIDTKSKIYNYDHTFVNLLGKLQNVLTDFHPQEFSATAYPVLDSLKEGLNGFTKELSYAYINKYAGSKPIEWHDDEAKEMLSQDGLKSARIFLTLIPEWDKHLPYLRRECIAGCSGKQISLKEEDKKSKNSMIVTNPLGVWFDCRGYKVSKFGEQEGELRNNSACQGTQIATHLSTFFNKKNTFGNLLYYLYEYYKLCHIKHIPSPNPPTTISQMLHWLCGLEYTPMYENMKMYLQEWYNEFKTEYEIEQTLPATVPKRTGHEVVTDFNLGNLLGSYQNVTIRASDVLLTILGYGDSDGRYACEFYTNPYNLDYPTDKSKCFDMLADICLRLNHQLRFLYMQCHNGPRSGGWADCRYGKNIAGSAWNCNRLQCVEQGCDRNCKWHNDCGVKSPLQSFLEDGLKGFLPHQFSSPSCKLECSVKNHNGIPCKTPMGFADISITASWTRTGRDIKNVLDPFCGTLPDSLSLLCAYFLCLLRRPPQTLCDMFAFYENFFEHWKGHYDSMRKEHVKKHKHDAFYAAVAKANFGVEYDGLDPTTMFGSSSHSSDATTHLEGDLFAIVNCKPNENPVHPCGSYLQPLSYEVRCVFTEKLAADYLSWIVYITETFYTLLNDLYNKCTKCCIQQQADCYGRICAKGCTVDSTTESPQNKKLPDITHGELCNSIVQCAGIHPTIFAAGFTFGSPWNLSGDNGVGKKRSCKDFCTALGLVVKENNVLYMLVHEKIPAFLWEIRYKFFYTLVALWSYSLLYLLYVIIGRLDTFHIRSHLRLPSSHKISAQSLLATARLNNLAKLAYLRP